MRFEKLKQLRDEIYFMNEVMLVHICPVTFFLWIHSFLRIMNGKLCDEDYILQLYTKEIMLVQSTYVIYE